MRLSTLPAALFFTIGSNACAQYKDCKCHSTVNGQQNDGVTKKACEIVHNSSQLLAVYNDSPNHEVRNGDYLTTESPFRLTIVANTTVPRPKRLR
jgi:hypothetical protein